MKTFTNTNARSPQEAVHRAAEARAAGKVAVFASGGSDVLQLIKDRIVSPDVVVNLKTMPNLDRITRTRSTVRIGGQITLDTLSRNDLIRKDYYALAEAAAAVATPQIRSVGTIAGNVAQRPWCWYYRNGFTCYKNGGNQCFSFSGENQLHAIFGGGPSYIVHPSDTAPALVALGATFRIVGPGGERTVPASEFFVLPRANPAKENVLADDDVIVAIDVPASKPGTRSRYFKVMDRETWTHAVVAAVVVLEMDQDVCQSARVVLGGVAPIPWRAQAAETVLTGQRITDDVAARAGEAAVTGARALSKNAYKIPMTRAIVRRTVQETARQA